MKKKTLQVFFYISEQTEIWKAERWRWRRLQGGTGCPIYWVKFNTVILRAALLLSVRKAAKKDIFFSGRGGGGKGLGNKKKKFLEKLCCVAK